VRAVLLDLSSLTDPALGLEATGKALAKKGVGDLARNLAFDRVPGLLRRSNGLNEGFDFGGILRQGPASYRVNGSRVGAVGRGVLRVLCLPSLVGGPRNQRIEISGGPASRPMELLHECGCGADKTSTM
jgi:hypothetical protein